MSGGSDVLALKEDDITKMLAAETHLGETNGPDFQMAQYVFKVKSDGKAELTVNVVTNLSRYCYY